MKFAQRMLKLNFLVCNQYEECAHFDFLAYLLSSYLCYFICEIVIL